MKIYDSSFWKYVDLNPSPEETFAIFFQTFFVRGYVSGCIPTSLRPKAEKSGNRIPFSSSISAISGEQ